MTIRAQRRHPTLSGFEGIPNASEMRSMIKPIKNIDHPSRRIPNFGPHVRHAISAPRCSILDRTHAKKSETGARSTSLTTLPTPDTSSVFPRPSMGNTATVVRDTVVRELEIADFEKGFLDVLAQLTTVGDVTQEAFTARFNELAESPDYTVLVIEDPTKSRIVGTAVLFCERKFIHGCGKVGHVEDVVVDQEYRGQKLAQKLIGTLSDAARTAGCYKMILDCQEGIVPFYEKCGLSRRGVQMAVYFE